MRCRRICRELLWLARFGEFGPSSAPHLDHLAGCGACRDEVGFDRALVQQLRIALAERIADDEPSSRSWDVILARAQAPEGGIGGFLRSNAALLAARMRTATAVSALALATIIATSTQIAVTHPEAGSAETEVRTSAAGEQFELQALVPRPRRVATPVVYVAAAAPSDPEMAFLVSATLPPATVAAPAQEPPDEETAIEASLAIGTTFSRLTPADTHDAPRTAPEREAAPRVEGPAGEPY